jgi:hypothetical protein
MAPTVNAQNVLDYLQANIGAGVGARNVTQGGQFSAADLASLLGAMGPGVTGAYKKSADGASCGSGPFGGYGTAGMVMIESTGANSIATGTMDITGADLPAGSILVLDSNVNGRFVTDVLSDGITNNLGAIGASFQLMSLANNNAPGIYLQTSATKTLKVQVQFTAASAAGDRVYVQVLAKGGGFLNKQSCAVS